MDEQYLNQKIIPITLMLTISFGGLWGLSLLGLNIPILRQVVGFIFITFVPGILILKIFNLYNLGTIKTLLMSVGLSLAFLMFIGAIANIFLPILGINKPISSSPIISCVGISTVALIVIAYLRNRRFIPPSNRSAGHEKPHFSLNVLLFLILLPILAVLGAIVVNSQRNNSVLLVLILIVTIIPISVAINKFIPRDMLPFAILSISLTLLLHEAMISHYLTGWDVHAEYYYQGLVIVNGHWMWSIPNNLNAMLSITVLCPIYSFILKIDSMWVLKIIYPLLFSLVPLILYEVYKEYWGPKRAFFASFLFVSMVIFFTEMISLGRQEIAEIFFSLLILLIVDRNIRPIPKLILTIVYIMSLVVSHYGLTYISIALFFMAWLLILLSKIRILRNWYDMLTRKMCHNLIPLQTNESRRVPQPFLLNGYLLIFFIAFTLVWYNLIASGAPFNTIVNIGRSIYSNLIDFVSMHAREPLISTALGLDWGQASTLGKVFRVIQYCIELSIVIYLFNLILRYRVSKVKVQYRVLALASGLMLLICVVIPYFSSYLNATRFFQIGLILLSPICISGLEDSFKIIICGLKHISRKVGQNVIKPAFLYLFILIILIPYYLFNTGFIFEVSKSSYIAEQIPSSMALSNTRVDFTDYNLDEAIAAQWLLQHSNDQTRVYGDIYSQLALGDYLYTRVDTLPDDLNQMSDTNYIFLRSWNIQNNQRVLSSGKEVGISDTSKLVELIKNEFLVYNNGHNQIIAP
jgi:uncharacterized membrane protein